MRFAPMYDFIFAWEYVHPVILYYFNVSVREDKSNAHAAMAYCDFTVMKTIYNPLAAVPLFLLVDMLNPNRTYSMYEFSSP